ncbi:MAG: hypothetical protein HYW01_07975, partial [Deltaproteobacteria bacterium]|nr:hypothetical protein [Deltaproteobacteria bacterium]
MDRASGKSGDPLQGTSYQVPADVSVGQIFQTSASSQIFYTYSAIYKYFSTQFGLSGLDPEGMFWGSAEANFSISTYESNSYYYGIYEILASRWAVTLSNAILNTPLQSYGSTLETTFYEAAQAVPDNFDPTSSTSVDAFRKFFTEFGTHMVNSVTVGARSRCSVSIERSSNITEINAGPDIKAEYDYITGHLGAEASYVDKNYSYSRNRQFLTIGGNQELANVASSDPTSAAPPPNQNLTNYENWLTSTGANPAPIALGLIGMWNLGVFTSAQQTALKAAFDYFAIPNGAIPFYCYNKSESDYFYTTLENTEGLRDYKYQGTPFYVLPQGSTYSLAIMLHRYYNRLRHFFTSNPEDDADILTKGKYQEEGNYYSKVLPLTVQRLSPQSVATIYRWQLNYPFPLFVPAAHYFGTDQSAGPVDAQAFEGPKFTAFNAPSDPFSRSSLVQAAGIADVIYEKVVQVIFIIFLPSFCFYPYIFLGILSTLVFITSHLSVPLAHV